MAKDERQSGDQPTRRGRPDGRSGQRRRLEPSGPWVGNDPNEPDPYLGDDLDDAGSSKERGGRGGRPPTGTPPGGGASGTFPYREDPNRTPAPIDRARSTVERAFGGRPVSSIAILTSATLVLVVLLLVIFASRDDEEPNPGAPCIDIETDEAIAAIVAGNVAQLRATTRSDELTALPLALELDLEDGTCRALPQGANAVDDRSAVIGAAVVYNDQTDGRTIEISITAVDLSDIPGVPPTPTPTNAPQLATPSASPATPISSPGATPSA